MNEQHKLTNTEWEVYECLWERAPLTITQIANRLIQRTGWSRSTGETLVRRMTDKGLLRWEQGSKAKLYYPLFDRESAALRETHNFLRKVFGGSLGLMVNAVAEQEDLSREEIDQLYEALRKMEENAMSDPEVPLGGLFPVMGENFLYPLAAWAVTSSLLILVVAALRAVVKERVSPALCYGLWLLVLARLLFPGNIAVSPVSVLNTLPERGAYQTVRSEHAAVPGEEADGLSASSDPAELAAGLYLAGAALTGGYQLAVNLRFGRSLRRRRWPMGRVGGRKFYAAEGLDSPCLFGFFRPAIYLTPVVAADPVASPHVLAHEYTHFRHLDHIWAFLRGVCLTLHWYNPLVWWAADRSRRDCELACDAGTVGLLGERQRAEYGRTLVSLATRQAGVGDLVRCATTMTGGRSSIKERISRLIRNPRTSAPLCCLVAAVCLTAAACTFTGGEITPAAQAISPAAAEPAPFPEEFPLPDALKEKGLKFLPGKHSTWELGKIYRENKAERDRVQKAARRKFLLENNLA